jgi:pilus assembly protein CpaF
MIPAEVFEETVRGFLKPVLDYLDDPSVTEIMINGPDTVFIERKGRLIRTEASFSPDLLLSLIRNIAQFQGVLVGDKNPILEARLPDGSRVEAILPPAGSGGPHVAIRRFAKDKLTIDKLLEYGSLSEDAASALRSIVEGKQNVIVAGGTGSGKTSMLNCLSSFIPDGERVVVIEDARELQMQGTHVVHLEAQKPDPRGIGAVTVADLFKATLRMRPDRIVLGEIRGGEALQLVQAMTSGHGGCMSTVHATYPRDTLSRLETMALMSEVDLPLFALRSQVASAIDFVVQTSRIRDGSRCVTHITEVMDADPQGGYQLQDIFVREHARGRTELRPTGIVPQCAPALSDLGLELPAAIYEAARLRPE